MQRRMTSNRWNFAFIILGLLFAATLVAPPASAQIVANFTKDDCNRWNNVCQPGENCDDVGPPLFSPVRVPRPADVGDTIQYVLQITNDGTPKTGLTLEDILPECVNISCANTTCVDSDCDTVPDAGPVYITSTDPSTTDPVPTCMDPTPGNGGTVTLPPFDLAADEVMDIKYCGIFVIEENCCNTAVLSDGVQTQNSIDRIDPQMPEELCIDVGGGGLIQFYKDDCDPARTGDPPGCDDVETVGGQRSVTPPSAGKKVMWVLRWENLDQPPWTNFNIVDNMIDTGMWVACAPGDYPPDPTWGCFEVTLDGNPVPPNGTCTPEDGGAGIPGIDINQDVPASSVLEVRFCAVAVSIQAEYCNSGAYIEPTTPPTQQAPPFDNLDGDRRVCFTGDVPRPEVSADKSVVNLTGGFPAAPGDRVEYTIAICETGGSQVILDFTDPIPSNIVNAALDPAAPPECQIVADQIICAGMVIPGGQCAPDIIWQGDVDCTGISGGDPICNQGSVNVTDPPPGGTVPTNDPNTPAQNDATCFNLGLDDLSTSTKTWVIADDADLSGDETCGDTITYTITVISSGANDASMVALADVIDPADGGTYQVDTTYVDGVLQTPDPFDAGTNTLLLDLGDIPSGAQVEVKFDVFLEDLGGDYQLCNRATMTTTDTATCGAPPYSVSDGCFTVGCASGGPSFEPVDKQVLDNIDEAQGNVVTTAAPGTVLWYHINWCNTGDQDMNDVEFVDSLPPCTVVDPAVGLDQVVRFDDGPVVDPFTCGNPPDQICFLADPLMTMGECHEITIQILVEPCPEGTDVSNVATIRSLELPGGQASDPATGGEFTIAAPSGADLRRDTFPVNDVCGNLDPDCWCDSANPRLTTVIEPLPAFPYCVGGDGAIGANDPLVFYEASDPDDAGCLGKTLTVVRRGGCGDTDIEVDYQ